MRETIVTQAPQRTVGECVRELRLRRGWGVLPLARRAGISKAYMIKLEKGEANPSEDVIKRLAAALDVPAAVLLGEVPLAETELAPSLREFVETDVPEADILAAMRALDFHGHPPQTAREWRQIYRVIKALTDTVPQP
jgi:transcriptional regulator with XRE-family HTH domain